MSDPIDQLRTASVPLFAELSLPAKTGFFGRLLGKGTPPPEPLGALSLDGHTLQILRGEHGVVCAVETSEPFAIDLGRCGEGQGAIELWCRIRPPVVDPENPLACIEVRTVWPADAVAPSVEAVDGQGLFVPPARFGTLWRALDALARARGSSAPAGIDLDVPEGKLNGLESVSTPPCCLPCESVDVVVPYPGVVRCLVCDYAGGPGIDDMRERDRRVELMAAPALKRWRLGILNLHWAAFQPNARMRPRIPLPARRLLDASYQLPGSAAEIGALHQAVLADPRDEIVGTSEAAVLAIVERECGAVDDEIRVRQIKRLTKLALRATENFHTSVSHLDSKAASSTPELLKDAREASFALRVVKLLDPARTEFVDGLLELLDESIRNPERVLGNNDELPKVQAVIDALEPWV